MDRNINNKNLLNIGGFKNRLTKSYSSGFDTKTFTKLNNLINNLTDSLFLPLSSGIRAPAIISAKIYADGTGGWAYKNVPFNNLSFITDVTANTTLDVIDSLDIILNTAITSKSDISCLYFISNVSDITTGQLTDDRVIFPRVTSVLSDNTVRVVLECAKDTDWGNYEETDAESVSGLAFFIEGLYQSSAENEDRIFYTPSTPYFELQLMYANVTTLRPAGLVYTDLQPGGFQTEWSSKIRSRAQYWPGDCTTGSGVGIYYYSAWEESYKIGVHDVEKIYGLAPNTKYKVWVQIDSKIGPDNLDWTDVGCYTTKPSGDPGDEHQISPP